MCMCTCTCTCMCVCMYVYMYVYVHVHVHVHVHVGGGTGVKSRHMARFYPLCQYLFREGFSNLNAQQHISHKVHMHSPPSTFKPYSSGLSKPAHSYTQIQHM